MSKSTHPSPARSRVVPFTLAMVLVVLCALLIFTPNPGSAAGILLAGWGFEGVTTTNTGQTPTVSVGSPAADSGALTAGSAFTGFHTSAATAWSNPAGNASVKSVSANNWAVGDYYQFSCSTIGYNAINITWDQTGSNTGPRDFKVQYSTNGTTFTDATGTNSTYVVTNDSWSSSGSPKSVSRRTLDLSAVSALDNQATVYIRLVDTSATAVTGGTVATGGTGRIDNFTVNGTAVTSTNPSGTGNANPSSVAPTQTTLLTVTVTPGTNPTSLTHTVVADLSSIGGAANQTFFDDGTNGDVTPNDNVFSFSATVALGTTGGVKNLPFTITETSPLART